MKKISVFANFYINDYERFLRMKDSFLSFNKAKIDMWVINVRGKFSKKSIDFFNTKLKKKNFYISSFDSGSWFNDSKQLLDKIDTKYVFFWVEDHICLRQPKVFNSIINEMDANDLDYLQYSWFIKGLNLKSLDNIRFKQDKNILFLNYTKSILRKRLNWFKKNNIKNNLLYVISQQSILKLELFTKILNKKEFSLFRKNLPFAFEKNHRYTNWLPYKIGFVKKEFFASIDDDVGHKGYSLISRGFYEDRISSYKKKLIERNRLNSSNRYSLIGQLYYSTLANKIKKFITKII